MNVGTIKKKGLGITFPVVLLVLVILSTIGLYSYNYVVEGDISKLSERISDKENEIKNIKKDKNIQVYALISDNEKILKKLESYSQITEFMNGLIYIRENYNLILDGFNYSNGVITTKAVTDSERVSNAYIATSSFIERYRKDKNKAAIFKLPFISKIVGSSDISFNLKLEIKDNFKK